MYGAGVGVGVGLVVLCGNIIYVVLRVCAGYS